MSLKYPDILEHNNPNNPLVDINQLKGITNINLLVERDTIPLAKRRLEHFVVCKATSISYIYTGTTIADVDWNNSANWVSGGGITTLPASQISVTPNVDFTSTDQQSFNEEIGTLALTVQQDNGTLQELIETINTDETPEAIADTDNVRFKSATGWYNRTLLAIYDFFVEKSVPPEELFDLLDTDAMFGARGTDARYWSFALIIQKLLNYLPKDTCYSVTTWDELQAIVGSPTCPETVNIIFTKPVNGSTLQTYAKNIMLSGAKIVMLSDANLWISGYTSGTYNVYINCLLETGPLGMPSYITLGDTQVVSTINLKLKQIKGLSDTTIPTVELLKVGASNTVSITYNELVNVLLINTAITPLQEDTFYATIIRTHYIKVAVSGTYAGPYSLVNLPDGWMLDSVELRSVSGDITGATVEIDNGSGFYTDISTPCNLLSSNTLYLSMYPRLQPLYDQWTYNDQFLYYLQNRTSNGMMIRYKATSMLNTTTVIAITIKKAV